MPNRAEHLRQRSGCGATDLGKLLGISRRQVQRLLAGKAPNLPTDTLLGRLLAMPEDAFRLYVLHVTGKPRKDGTP